MKHLSKIFVLALVAILPFTVVNAQHKHKKKRAAVTASKKAVAKKKTGSKKKGIKSRKKETLVERANDNSIGNVKIETPAVVQADTVMPRVVTVTSSFKPSLRNAAKINFTAATPLADSSRLPLNYSIPSQSLFFIYQPVAIKPLELPSDSVLNWVNNEYIKLGFGNYTTPYVEAGIALGKSPAQQILLHGQFTSSKGPLTYQQFSKTGVDADGIFTTKNNLEINSKLFYNNSNQFKYGFTSGTFTKEQLQQQFNTVGFELGLKNKSVNDYGLTYHPQIKLSSFFDNNGASEFDVIANAPVTKEIGKMFAFHVAATADITSLNTAAQIHNNLVYLNTGVQFKTPNFKLNAGVQPSWDNSNFSLLPDVSAEAKLRDESFILLAGWHGYFQKNSYQSLVGYNPWISQPLSLTNTKFTEQYAGFKGSAGKHITYNATLSFLKIENQALFVNSLLANNSQSFDILYEPKLEALKLHGELSYTEQEKFIFTAAADYFQYTNQQQYDKPWGLLPLQVTGTMKYKLNKDFMLKSDLFVMDGAWYRNPATLESQKAKAAFDMNVGAEYSIAPRLNLWLNFNNLFNNKYQRWNQYEVLGFNVLAGVVYSFR
ncbi:MAG: hypothetical protein KGO81_05740 [Bacteroidota bacterium]|nr:hypothetical protein [Bacteroidota bacterium]